MNTQQVWKTKLEDTLSFDIHNCKKNSVPCYSLSYGLKDIYCGSPFSLNKNHMAVPSQTCNCHITRYLYLLVKIILDKLRILKQTWTKQILHENEFKWYGSFETPEWSTKENLLEANAEPIWT